MKIGVKVFPKDLVYAKKIAKYPDFLEVMAVPGSDFTSLTKIDTKYSVHVAHGRWGFNPADSSKISLNDKIIRCALSAADILEAKEVVVHAGMIENKACSVLNAKSCIKRLDDRFIVENLPYGKQLCATPDEVSSFLHGTNKGFCLDFPHAAISAFRMGSSFDRVIDDFMKLKPAYFHTSDLIVSEGDKHLPLGEGNLGFDYLRYLPKDCSIVLETVHNLEKQKREISLLRSILG